MHAIHVGPIYPVRPFFLDHLCIMTKEPFSSVAVAPEDRILRRIESHLLVPVLLLLTVVDMEDVLVLASLGLHQARPRHADLLILLYGRGHVHVLGQHLTQDGGVLKGLGSALGQVRQHRVAAIAQQHGFARWVSPAGEVRQVAQTPLHELSSEGAELPHLGFPAGEALAQLAVVAPDDPDLVRCLVVGGGTYDDVVHLAVADRVADQVGIRSTP